MKNRLIISGIICSVFVFLSPQNTFADGMMMYKPDPFADRWDYAPESSQQAFINYEAGREKMILSIGVDNQTHDAVWLFPVPANPDEVTIDVITELPRFSGEQLDRKAESNLQQIKKIAINNSNLARHILFKRPYFEIIDANQWYYFRRQ